MEFAASYDVGNVVEALEFGDVSSPWHDVRLFKDHAVAPPDAAQMQAAVTWPRCNFVCMSSRASRIEIAAMESAAHGSNDISASFISKRKYLSVDSTVSPDDCPLAPWHRGILPQTSVLASTSTSWLPSVIVEHKMKEAALNETADTGSYSFMFDSAPVEALDVSTIQRELGDVYEVIPLMILPVRQRESSVSAISWKVVVIAADDPAILLRQVAAVAIQLLPVVAEWAVMGGHSSTPDTDGEAAKHIMM